MAKIILNRKKVNPSVPVFTGERHVETLSVQLFKYNKNECTEDIDFSEDDLSFLNEKNYKFWLNIHGIHDVDKIIKICQELNVHDLAIQDLLDVNQRPKLQEFNNHLFFTLKSLIPADDLKIEQEQLSFFLGSNYLVSFQEKKGDFFDHIRERLRKKIGLVRERGTDYLLYLLLESILDNYFKTLNHIENTFESIGLIDMESDPSPELLKSIEFLKRQINKVKNTVVPIKEFVTKLEREKFGFIHEKHVKYYYELKDLCLSLIDNCDYMDAKLESSTNLFFSVQGHRMNQVMKTLTIVATIFIPLTFIAGIYGMNFANMPELAWKWGYPGVWGIMIAVTLLMLFYFKRKKW